MAESKALAKLTRWLRMMRTLAPNCTEWLPAAQEMSSLMVCVGLMRLLVRSKFRGEKTKRKETALAAESPCEVNASRERP
jgi:hypothetical protein